MTARPSYNLLDHGYGAFEGKRLEDPCSSVSYLCAILLARNPNKGVFAQELKSALCIYDLEAYYDMKEHTVWHCNSMLVGDWQPRDDQEQDLLQGHHAKCNQRSILMQPYLQSMLY